MSDSGSSICHNLTLFWIPQRKQENSQTRKVNYVSHTNFFIFVNDNYFSFIFISYPRSSLLLLTVIRYSYILINLDIILKIPISLFSDDNRLRGGVLAMCGVTIVLLLLLVICAIILHRQRSRRFTVVDENHH